ATLGRFLLDCPVDVLAEGTARHQDEDEFAPARRKAAAPAAMTSLHDDWASLRRTRHCERAARAKPGALGRQAMCLLGMGEQPGRAVTDQGIVLPTVPVA